MERPAEFDLEHALAEWRAAFESLPEVDSEELAAHLRDAFGELRGRGLAPEEAWLVACHRLGSTSELESEFARATGRFHFGRMRIVAGFVLLGLALDVIRVASAALVFALGVRSASSVIVAAILLGSTGIALLVLAASRIGQMSERKLSRMFVGWRAVGLLVLLTFGIQWCGPLLYMRFWRSEALREALRNGDLATWLAPTLACAPLQLAPLLLVVCVGLLHRRSERRAQRDRILASLVGRNLPPNGAD